MTRFAAILLAGFMFAGIAGAAELGPIQADKSRLAFVSKQMGVPVEGEFRKFAVQMSFDPAKPEAGKAQIEIDMASIDAGSAEANEEVVGKNWFNVKQFPKASFVSSSVKALGGNKYEVAGQLSIKGKTQDVLVPATFTAQGNTGVFDGGFTIRRGDFAIGEGSWAKFDIVANEVQIKFRITATGK